MVPDIDIHFAGAWNADEKELLREAVDLYERVRDIQDDSGDSDVSWVCLHLQLHQDQHCVGYRLGEDDMLTAPSASLLAEEIVRRAKNRSKTGSLQAEIEEAWHRGGIPPYRLRKVIDFVRSQISDAITVAQMAQQARMSSAHFARLFKQSLGLTPMQYLTQCRIEHAQRLLRSTELKIEEISRRVGLKSASHFAEVFRKRTGMTPREYRNRFGD